MSKKRINIEGLPEHLREAALKALKPRVDEYILGVFGGASHSARKSGRIWTATHTALLKRKKFLGPNQSASLWVALRYGNGDVRNEPTPKGIKLSEEYDKFLKQNNPKE